jgi:hypothetical protein
MSDHKGDPSKQSPECQIGKDGVPFPGCPNLKNTYEGMDGERYSCEVCGESFFLDYDEMR